MVLCFPTLTITDEAKLNFLYVAIFEPNKLPCKLSYTANLWTVGIWREDDRRVPYGSEKVCRKLCRLLSGVLHYASQG